ncbi:MAG: hypothetical protein AAF226_03970, partial [Verrucomicrobiota bacterium]
LRNISAQLLETRTGKERDLAIEKMRKILREGLNAGQCWQIFESLGKMKATEARPELVKWSPHSDYAIAALSQLDQKAAEALLLEKFQGIRSFGTSYFTEMARVCNNGNLKADSFVPYLVEACKGFSLVNYGDSEIRAWLHEITGIKTNQMSKYRTWWEKRNPDATWPIKEVRVRDNLSNLEFVVD